MLRIVGILLAIWLVFAIVGLIVDALFFLFFVGVILFVATSIWGWLKKG